MNRLVTVKSYTTRMEANIAKGLLESEGIPSIVMSDDVGGAYPMHFSSGAELKVNSDMVAKAQKVLISISKRKPV